MDSADTDRTATAKVELASMLQEMELKNAPLLVLANKQVYTPCQLTVRPSNEIIDAIVRCCRIFPEHWQWPICQMRWISSPSRTAHGMCSARRPSRAQALITALNGKQVEGRGAGDRLPQADCTI